MNGIPFDTPLRRGFARRALREQFARGPHHHHGGPGFGPGFGPGMFGAGFGPGGFGPGRGGRARRGDVRAAILSLLADGPSNGYGLIKAIAERTEGAWRPSPGSVYPTLQQLVDEGLVAQAATGKEYSLTDAGRAHVTEHADELAAAWEQAGSGRAGWDDAFVDSARKLAMAVGQFPGSATAEQRTQAAAKLDELRRELYRILGE
jgi:DNA-binding PadR family transcriptional regulator